MKMDKPPLMPFTTNEIRQFVDHYMEHSSYLTLDGHTERECHDLAEFLGLGYLQRWSESEIQYIKEHYLLEGAHEIAARMPFRTAQDVRLKAYDLGLKTIAPRKKNRSKRIDWLLWETQILEQYWQVLGYRVAALLPDRTEAACIGRAEKLGLKWRTNTLWTEHELAVLKEHYPSMGQDVVTLLPQKNLQAIRTRAHQMSLKVTGRDWTEQEDAILREHYLTMRASVCERLPGRTKSACQNRAKRLGILPKAADREWSAEEVQILKMNYPTMGTQVADLLPNRTEIACYERAKRLGIRGKTKVRKGAPWTEEEIAILQQHYAELGGEVISLLPRHSKKECNRMARKLGLTTRIPWTEDEDRILRENYPSMGRAVYQILPGRSCASCYERARKVMGLAAETNRWTDKEDEVLRTYYAMEGADVANRLPGRTAAGCHGRAALLGIKKNIAKTYAPSPNGGCGHLKDH